MRGCRSDSPNTSSSRQRASIASSSATRSSDGRPGGTWRQRYRRPAREIAQSGGLASAECAGAHSGFARWLCSVVGRRVGSASASRRSSAPSRGRRGRARRRGLRVRQRDLPRLDRSGMALVAPDRRDGDDRRRQGLLGWSRPTAASSRSTRRSSARSAGWPLAQPVVGMTATPTGHGYWIVTADGCGVPVRRRASRTARWRACGSTRRSSRSSPGRAARATGCTRPTVACSRSARARFHGSTGAMRLNAPVVGMAATPSGDGYWLVATDGGIFSFGDAHFFGSTGAMHLNAPVVGMARDGSGDGYWLAGADGGVFTFGDAQFQGSAAGPGARRPPRRAARRHARRQRLPHARADEHRPTSGSMSQGASGAAVTDVQNRLLSLGYWLPGANGVFDDNMQQAVYAFQKVERPAAHRRRRRRRRRPSSAPRAGPVPALDERVRDRDRQDPPDPDRRARTAHVQYVVQRVDRLRSPVHARRRAATPRTRPRASSPSSARSTAPTTARSARCAGRSTSRGRASRCTATPIGAAVSRRRTAACACRTRRSTSSGPPTSCRSARRSGCTSEARRRGADRRVRRRAHRGRSDAAGRRMTEGGRGDRYNPAPSGPPSAVPGPDEPRSARGQAPTSPSPTSRSAWPKRPRSPRARRRSPRPAKTRQRRKKTAEARRRRPRAPRPRRRPRRRRRRRRPSPPRSRSRRSRRPKKPVGEEAGREEAGREEAGREEPPAKKAAGEEGRRQEARAAKKVAPRRRRRSRKRPPRRQRPR